MHHAKADKIELVAPAGNLEKLKFSVLYGADAVYLSGEKYGLRARAGNFSLDEMDQAVRFAHEKAVRVYLALNIFARNHHLAGLQEYLSDVNDIGIDAVIISDPGVLSIVRETLPEMKVHISTQANNTNWRTAEFWRAAGASRIICSRELSLEEISEIAGRSSIELEAFVHGAMCISYSGRCLLSSFMANRSANEGDCAQPCRWRYRLVEQERPREDLIVEEDGGYTYIFSSRDLCMIQHLPRMIGAGLAALKIEGRMKSAFYHALATRAYREAIDDYYEDPQSYRVRPEIVEELARLSTRGGYTTGFYLNRPGHKGQLYEGDKRRQPRLFLGYVINNGAENRLKVKAKNKISVGDKIEFIGPDPALNCQARVEKIFHDDLVEGEYTYADETVYIETTTLNNSGRAPEAATADDYDIIRKATD